MKLKRKAASIGAAAVLTLALLAGCSGTNTAESTAASAATAGTTISAVSTDEDMFTERDKQIGYDESESTVVTLSDGTASVKGDGASASGSTVLISAEGTYILSGTLNGQVVVAAADTAKIQIVLNGVSITNENSAAIWVKSADKVFLTTANGTENTVTTSGEFTAVDGSTNIDAAIFSKAGLTLNGAGTLAVKAPYGHGVVSKDDLKVTCGTYEITSQDHALNGKDSVRIADGTFALTTDEDAVHASDDDDTTKGFVYMEGGTFTISAGDDGIHAGAALIITGGAVNIRKSNEGMEGKTIAISGGKISVVSSDDGLNASEGSSTNARQGGPGGMQGDSSISLTISGGNLTINAGGDGIDSNGSLTVSGGVTTVYGPTDDGNSAIDYGEGCTATVTGGTLLAAGSSGMAESFADSSTQGSILYVLSSQQAAGTQVTLKDSGGNVLAQFTPEKTFSALNISVEGLAGSGTYTLTVGSQSDSIEMNAISYSNKTGGMGGGMGAMGGGRMPQGGKDGPRQNADPQRSAAAATSA